MSIVAQQGVKEYSCHICYFICVSPVTCVNGHLFCRSCLSKWIASNPRCPTCRSPMEESELRAVIGADASEESMHCSIARKAIRTSRFNFLKDLYEEEISRLLSEVEKLNSRLEQKELETRSTQTVDRMVDSSVLTNATGQLEKAVRMYVELKAEMDSLRKVNDDLEMQNRTLSREMKTLKEDSNGKSPYKYGRFVVNSLERRIENLEKEKTQLAKALEKQDTFISDLQSRNNTSQGIEQKRTTAIGSVLLPSPMKPVLPTASKNPVKENGCEAVPAVTEKSRIPVRERSPSPSKKASSKSSITTPKSAKKGNPHSWLQRPTNRKLIFEVPTNSSSFEDRITETCSLSYELNEDFRKFAGTDGDSSVVPAPQKHELTVAADADRSGLDSHRSLPSSSVTASCDNVENIAIVAERNIEQHSNGIEFPSSREEDGFIDDEELSGIFSDTEKRVAERTLTAADVSGDISSISPILSATNCLMATSSNSSNPGSLALHANSEDLQLPRQTASLSVSKVADCSVMESVQRTLQEIQELRSQSAQAIAARCSKRKIADVSPGKHSLSSESD